jgi:hypothetical protein
VTPAPSLWRRGYHEDRRGPPGIYPPDTMEAGRDAKPSPERAGQQTASHDGGYLEESAGPTPIRPETAHSGEVSHLAARGIQTRSSSPELQFVGLSMHRPTRRWASRQHPRPGITRSRGFSCRCLLPGGTLALDVLSTVECQRRQELIVVGYVSSLKVPPKMSEFPNVGGHWLLGPGRRASECDPGSSAAEARSRGRSPTIG